MKERLRKTAIKYAIILGIGLAYLIFVLFVGRGIPCVFYEITGFRCPGCGISRMFVSMARLDFVSAFHHNPFFFVTGPFLIAYFVCVEVKYVLHDSRKMGKWEIFLWVEIVGALLFGILRNVLL